MTLPIIFILFLGAGLILAVIAMGIMQNKYLTECENAPQYIIVPNQSMGYSIKEKTLTPIGASGYFMFYFTLYGNYKTIEEAQAVIEHLMKGIAV